MTYTIPTLGILLLVALGAVGFVLLYKIVFTGTQMSSSLLFIIGILVVIGVFKVFIASGFLTFSWR